MTPGIPSQGGNHIKPGKRVLLFSLPSLFAGMNSVCKYYPVSLVKVLGTSLENYMKTKEIG